MRVHRQPRIHGALHSSRAALPAAHQQVLLQVMRVGCPEPCLCRTRMKLRNESREPAGAWRAPGRRQ